MRIHIIFTTGPFKAYLDGRQARQEYIRLRDLNDDIDYSLIDMPVIQREEKVTTDKCTCEMHDRVYYGCRCGKEGK